MWTRPFTLEEPTTCRAQASLKAAPCPRPLDAHRRNSNQGVWSPGVYLSWRQVNAVGLGTEAVPRSGPG